MATKGETHGVTVASLVPLLQVRSVPKSIAFYEALGFRASNTHTPEGSAEPVWAWLQCGSAQLMVGSAEGKPAQAPHATMLYVYTPDLIGMREALRASGVDTGPVERPFWAPGGEFQIQDPDGYVIMVTHT